MFVFAVNTNLYNSVYSFHLEFLQLAFVADFYVLHIA